MAEATRGLTSAKNAVLPVDFIVCSTVFILHNSIYIVEQTGMPRMVIEGV